MRKHSESDVNKQALTISFFGPSDRPTSDCTFAPIRRSGLLLLRRTVKTDMVAEKTRTNCTGICFRYYLRVAIQLSGLHTKWKAEFKHVEEIQ